MNVIADKGTDINDCRLHIMDEITIGRFYTYANSSIITYITTQRKLYCHQLCIEYSGSALVLYQRIYPVMQETSCCYFGQHCDTLVAMQVRHI